MNPEPENFPTDYRRNPHQEPHYYPHASHSGSDHSRSPWANEPMARPQPQKPKLDPGLVQRVVSYHGNEIMDLLDEEHHLEVTPIPAASEKRDPDLDSDEDFPSELNRFLARKGDIILKPDRKINQTKQQLEDSSTAEDYYSVMPPLETFMQVSSRASRQQFFQSIEKNDIVIGIVSAIQESGLVIMLLCLDNGKARDIDHLRITAFCPIREVPRIYAHESALEAFAIKDKVRGVITHVSQETERIMMSLMSRSLLPGVDGIKIGLISDEELPTYYRKIHDSQNRTFNDLLVSSITFHNPSTVSYMNEKLGLSEDDPPSIMRGLHSVNYPEEDCAENLRKAQASKWALKSVEAGIIQFKKGNLTEAMGHLTKALQIDPDNVEAMVARGALYANKESYEKAINDFEAALHLNRRHPNARKYICETLVVHGRLIEDNGRFDEAINCFKKALTINANLEEAHNCLQHLQERIAQQKPQSQPQPQPQRSHSSTQNISEDTHQDCGLEKTSSALRSMIESDKEEKRKRKRQSIGDESPPHQKPGSAEKKGYMYQRQGSSEQKQYRDDDRFESDRHDLKRSAGHQDELVTDRQSRRDQYEESKRAKVRSTDVQREDGDYKEFDRQNYRGSQHIDSTVVDMIGKGPSDWNKLGFGDGAKQSLEAFNADDIRKMAREFALNEKKVAEEKRRKENETDEDQYLYGSKSGMEKKQKKYALEKEINDEKTRIMAKEFKKEQREAMKKASKSEVDVQSFMKKVIHVGQQDTPRKDQPQSSKQKDRQKDNEQYYHEKVDESKDVYTIGRIAKTYGGSSRYNKEQELFDSFLPMFSENEHAKKASERVQLFNEFGDTDLRRLPGLGPLIDEKTKAKSTHKKKGGRSPSSISISSSGSSTRSKGRRYSRSRSVSYDSISSESRSPSPAPVAPKKKIEKPQNVESTNKKYSDLKITITMDVDKSKQQHSNDEYKEKYKDDVFDRRRKDSYSPSRKEYKQEQVSQSSRHQSSRSPSADARRRKETDDTGKVAKQPEKESVGQAVESHNSSDDETTDKFQIISSYYCTPCRLVLKNPKVAQRHVDGDEHKAKEEMKGKKVIPWSQWPVRGLAGYNFKCMPCNLHLSTMKHAICHSKSWAHRTRMIDRKARQKNRKQEAKDTEDNKPKAIIFKKEGASEYYCCVCDVTVGKTIAAVEMHTKDKNHLAKTEKMENKRKYVPGKFEIIGVINEALGHFVCKICLVELHAEHIIDSHLESERHKRKLNYIVEKRYDYSIEAEDFMDEVKAKLTFRPKDVTKPSHDEDESKSKKESKSQREDSYDRKELHDRKKSHDEKKYSHDRKGESHDRKESYNSRDESGYRKESYDRDKSDRRRRQNSSSDSSAERCKTRKIKERYGRDKDYDDDPRSSHQKQWFKEKDSNKRFENYEDWSKSRRKYETPEKKVPFQPIVKRPGENFHFCNLCMVKLYGGVNDVQEHSRNPEHLSKLQELDPPSRSQEPTRKSYSNQTGKKEQNIKESKKSKWDTDSDDDAPPFSQQGKVVRDQLSGSPHKKEKDGASLKQMETFLTMLKEKKKDTSETPTVKPPFIKPE